MPPRPDISALQDLRARIARLEGRGVAAHGHLPFGLPALDDHLPQGGLALGCLHEVAGRRSADNAVAAAFIAGIAGRLPGHVLWCAPVQDIFAPGLEQAGLPPGRVIFVNAQDDRDVLACMEEGLRHGGLSTVVAEVESLTMTASRRLHLAAKGTGTTGMVLWRGAQAEFSTFGQPTAAMTRWCVSALPSAPLPVPGVGRSRWRIELIRVRGGEPFQIEVEGCDATGHLGLSAPLEDRAEDRAAG
ncbi:ImuA family protein [Falsirhodobacter sp. 20TX0035]|uniref:ImuA family protein n=1 Tax=Falsirhodobacter sp. 20TX0035 TaxID=3022019 RepID=UPI00232B02BE|nr:damage-inducible protein [Falsirhodobacter sp. 20TX0035]MDB6453012.1 damage-inducible protein [Falsirhodobacter sp. 20TX0035]